MAGPESRTVTTRGDVISCRDGLATVTLAGPELVGSYRLTPAGQVARVSGRRVRTLPAEVRLALGAMLGCQLGRVGIRPMDSSPRPWDRGMVRRWEVRDGENVIVRAKT